MHAHSQAGFTAAMDDVGDHIDKGGIIVFFRHFQGNAKVMGTDKNYINPINTQQIIQILVSGNAFDANNQVLMAI